MVIYLQPVKEIGGEIHKMLSGFSALKQVNLISHSTLKLEHVVITNDAVVATPGPLHYVIVTLKIHNHKSCTCYSSPNHPMVQYTRPGLKQKRQRTLSIDRPHREAEFEDSGHREAHFTHRAHFLAE
jgi:hypothetical protein